MLRTLLALTAATFFLTHAEARARKKHKPAPAVAVSVAPSQAIEERVADEVATAQGILNDLERSNIFESPYVASAVYYHDGFLSAFRADKPDADPTGRVVAQIARCLTPDTKAGYVRLLHEVWDENGPHADNARSVLPVSNPETGTRRRRRAHRYAIDLFAPEGAAVRSATQGIVILADGNWSGDDPFSTSSLRGGNAVIVFDPSNDRFYRYCHLESVSVAAGAIIEAGQKIGAVGHTGFNASRPGHGGHLHFEVNEYDGRRVWAWNDKQIRALLRALQPI